MRTSVFLLLSLAWLACLASALPVEDCSDWSLQRCSTCLSNTATCGWCRSTGACLSAVDGAIQCPSPSTNWINPLGSVAYNSVSSSLVSSFSPPVSTAATNVFTPSNATASLRPGREFTFSISVKPTSNIPVDFYFLIDANSGMYSDIDTIKQLRTNISSWLATLSGDIRVGLGSFIEKPLQPFTDPVFSWPPAFIRTYNVKNHLNLTSSLSNWRTALDSVLVAGDYDGPTSALDALTQIAACTNTIGWRKQARKVLFFLTNDGYHLAMDGIRARIDQPFSPTCALTTNGATADLTANDYPSTQEFAAVFAQKDIIPIFAFPASRPHLQWAYGAPDGLVGKLGYGTTVQLTDRSTDILLRLQQAYAAIANNVYLYEASGSPLVTKISPSSASLLDATGAQVATSVTVSVTVSTPTRLASPVTLNLIAIGHPFSFPLILTDAAVPTCNTRCTGATCSGNCNGVGGCECGRCVNCTGSFGGVDCVSTASTVCPDTGGNVCNGHGYCEGFGRCVCDDGWQHDAIGGTYRFGSCACPTGACPSDINGLVCSNHGVCRCGSCACDSGYSGFDCSCDNSAACSSGCGGPSRGTCKCGTCECVYPWYGPSCTFCTPGAPGCPLSTTSICATYNNDCAACVSHSDAFNTSCFWCSDVQACIPTGNEQTCQQVITYSLLGDCPCLQDCENDIFVDYAASGERAYASVRKADTDVGPIIGLAFACVVAMGLLVLLIAKLVVEQQANGEWRRYFALRAQLQKTKGTKETSGLLSNQLYDKKKKKKKAKKSGSEDDDDDVVKKPKKKSYDEPAKKKKKKRQDSDDEEEDY